MNKKRSLLLFHIPVWVTAIFVAWFFSSDDFPEGRSSYVALSTLVFSAWMLGSFYLFYSWLVPDYLLSGKKKQFWLYSILYVLFLIPVAALTMFLVTGTSAFSLSEILSSKGLLPYLGSVTITLVCSVLGTLYRLLLNYYSRQKESGDTMTSTPEGL